MRDKAAMIKVSNGLNLINVMGKPIIVVDAGAKSSSDRMKGLDVNKKIRALVRKSIDRDSKKSSAGNLVSITIRPQFKKMIKVITEKLKDTYIVAEFDIAMALGAPFVSLSVLDQAAQIYSLETILVVNR